MARPEIIEKLEKVLNEDIVNEYQVVYILSRIRKLLELENKKKDYKFLNIYCNWALHTQIDRTESIFKELDDFINGRENDFLSFDYLKSDLKNFLNNYGLPTKIIDKEENYYRFVNLYLDVVSDSPMLLKLPNEIYNINIKKPEFPLPDFGYTVKFYVECIHK